jgi:hypothetical protein
MPRKSIGVAIVSRSRGAQLEAADALLEQRDQVRVGASQQRVEEPAVHVPVVAARRLGVGVRRRRGTHGREVERDSDGGVRAARAKCLNREAVRNEQVVRDL